jgi:hypothetical protein
MLTLSIKNWEKFQHYKDRSPPWIKLDTELLDDFAFGCLQDASKMHLVSIWLLAARTDSKVPYDAEWIAKRINATEPVDLDALIAAGFIIVNQPLQTATQVASKPLAKCLSRGETETETETEGETETETDAPRGARASSKASPAGFDEWYATYPKHVGKPKALQAYRAALKKVDAATLLAGAKVSRIQYADTEPQFIPQPATWLNQERWFDEIATTKKYSVKDDPAYRGVI